MKTNDLELFERYYNGEMDPGEKALFEKSLSEDAELNASYQEYLGIYTAIADKETLDLRLKLREIREENSKRRRGKDFLGQEYNWLWMAALITVIISFTMITSLLIKRQIAREEFLAVNMAPEPKGFEELDQELARFNQRNVDFHLDSPKDSMFLSRKNPILFKWTLNSPDPVILELIDWRGKIVFSSVKPVASPYIINKWLPGGIIVYRFRTETEAYQLGLLYLK